MTYFSENMQNTTSTSQNPLLTAAFGTPYEAVPFHAIELSHYLPAIKTAILEQKQEIGLITQADDAPTFANTIEALERSGKTLARVCNVFFNLLECCGTPEMMQLSEEIQPLLSEHHNNIMLNEALFARIKQVWMMREEMELTPEQRMLLKETYESYERNGATLPAEKRERWRQINTELDSLTLLFGQNALKATQAYRLHITDEADLAGLPEFHIKALAEEAARNGLDGWLVTLQAPSYRPFMTYSSCRPLRERLYRSFGARAASGEPSNLETIKKIVSLRLEKAQMMGKKNFAEYQLQDTMAKNVEGVYSLLHRLQQAYFEPALKEVEEIRIFAKQHEGEDFELQPWDFAYYSELLKKEKYAVNDELLKPYFPLEQVKAAIFGLAHTLYGITFTRNESIPKYHEEVEVYEVNDADGSYLGLFYADFFPRATKQAGAWMTEFKNQWRETDGHDNRPHISIVTNFTRPTQDAPSLLTYDEAGTFLHEFGHALHGLLTRCTYASLSGTRVAHDFVELPSQFMENYLSQRSFLDTFAKHYKTGEPIPEEWITRIQNARNFQAAYLCIRQLTFGFLDMAYHTIQEPISGSIANFEQRAIESTRLLPQVADTMISPSFSHIFAGGYAAGYYGYKWAEVLDADAFDVFLQQGIFNTATAARFRKLLESGGTVEPEILYRNFKGGDPDIQALMRRDGIL